MALTADTIPRYKGLVSSHPQLQDSSVTDDGSIVTTNGRAIAVATKTTTYVVLDTDELVVCNAPATQFTVTLPASAGLGRRIIVKSINHGAVLVTPNGADTIDGLNKEVILSRYESVTLVDYSSGAWVVIY